MSACVRAQRDVCVPRPNGHDPNSTNRRNHHRLTHTNSPTNQPTQPTNPTNPTNPTQRTCSKVKWDELRAASGRRELSILSSSRRISLWTSLRRSATTTLTRVRNTAETGLWSDDISSCRPYESCSTCSLSRHSTRSHQAGVRFFSDVSNRLVPGSYLARRARGG